MNILMVDDEDANLTLLTNILRRAGYTQITALEDARQVPEVFERVQPDLMLLDLHMPHCDGFEVMETLKNYLEPDSYFPILMLTADSRPDVKQQALASGAKDFLQKPFDASEVRLRIQNLLEARSFHLQLQRQNEQLEQRVRERTKQLEDAHIEMLVRLAKAAEYRDDESGEHIWRVARTASLLAFELGLANEQAELLLRASRLHDVGKIGIPDGIYLKPGKLTVQEFEVVKTHTTVGANLLSGGRSKLMNMAELIALTHHKRWDGTGYPQGLRGEQIPIEGRILAVADAFDAMTHNRPHRRALPVPKAVAEIKAGSAQHFDPQVVAAFLKLHERSELLATATLVSRY